MPVQVVVCDHLDNFFAKKTRQTQVPSTFGYRIFQRKPYFEKRQFRPADKYATPLRFLRVAWTAVDTSRVFA
jgi:hypothetical protein